MKGILDRVSKSALSASYSHFRPKSPGEFFALRLAQKLGDSVASKHYVELTERYSEAQLLVAYRRATSNGSGANVIRNFHTELERVSGKHVNGMPNQRIAAIQIERRAIAVVILKGERLEYPPLVRRLPAKDKALASIGLFLNWVMERCSFERAALETVPNTSRDVQRSALNQMAKQFLTEQTISIWEIPKRVVLAAYGHPPLRFRKELREVAATMWPEVDGSLGSPLIYDALTLGLYCQVEFLFNL
jgi:hypothetical protein